MAHRRFQFEMPASSEVVFDTFHYHQWRLRWDSLVDDTRVMDGAPCPYAGAVTENSGGGLLKALSMRTQFVSFDRPRNAAAAMLGTSFPFRQWAASMQHKSIDDRRSLIIYTYTFRAGPRGLSWLVEPIVRVIFDWQTRRRFRRMHEFLVRNAHEVAAWQHSSANAEPVV
jgi:hypothetical protein